MSLFTRNRIPNISVIKADEVAESYVSQSETSGIIDIVKESRRDLSKIINHNIGHDYTTSPTEVLSKIATAVYRRELNIDGSVTAVDSSLNIDKLASHSICDGTVSYIETESENVIGSLTISGNDEKTAKINHGTYSHDEGGMLFLEPYKNFVPTDIVETFKIGSSVYTLHCGMYITEISGDASNVYDLIDKNRIIEKNRCSVDKVYPYSIQGINIISSCVGGDKIYINTDNGILSFDTVTKSIAVVSDNITFVFVDIVVINDYMYGIKYNGIDFKLVKYFIQDKSTEEIGYTFTVPPNTISVAGDHIILYNRYNKFLGMNGYVRSIDFTKYNYTTGEIVGTQYSVNTHNITNIMFIVGDNNYTYIGLNMIMPSILDGSLLIYNHLDSSLTLKEVNRGRIDKSYGYMSNVYFRNGCIYYNDFDKVHFIKIVNDKISISRSTDLIENKTMCKGITSSFVDDNNVVVSFLDGTTSVYPRYIFEYNDGIESHKVAGNLCEFRHGDNIVKLKNDSLAIITNGDVLTHTVTPYTRFMTLTSEFNDMIASYGFTIDSDNLGVVLVTNPTPTSVRFWMYSINIPSKVVSLVANNGWNVSPTIKTEDIRCSNNKVYIPIKSSADGGFLVVADFNNQIFRYNRVTVSASLDSFSPTISPDCTKMVIGIDGSCHIVTINQTFYQSVESVISHSPDYLKTTIKVPGSVTYNQSTYNGIIYIDNSGSPIVPASGRRIFRYANDRIIVKGNTYIRFKNSMSIAEVTINGVTRDKGFSGISGNIQTIKYDDSYIVVSIGNSKIYINETPENLDNNLVITNPMTARCFTKNNLVVTIDDLNVSLTYIGSLGSVSRYTKSDVLNLRSVNIDPELVQIIKGSNSRIDCTSISTFMGRDYSTYTVMDRVSSKILGHFVMSSSYDSNTNHIEIYDIRYYKCTSVNYKGSIGGHHITSSVVSGFMYVVFYDSSFLTYVKYSSHSNRTIVAKSLRYQPNTIPLHLEIDGINLIHRFVYDGAMQSYHNGAIILPDMEFGSAVAANPPVAGNSLLFSHKTENGVIACVNVYDTYATFGWGPTTENIVLNDQKMCSFIRSRIATGESYPTISVNGTTKDFSLHLHNGGTDFVKGYTESVQFDFIEKYVTSFCNPSAFLNYKKYEIGDESNKFLDVYTSTGGRTSFEDKSGRVRRSSIPGDGRYFELFGKNVSFISETDCKISKYKVNDHDVFCDRSYPYIRNVEDSRRIILKTFYLTNTLENSVKLLQCQYSDSGVLGCYSGRTTIVANGVTGRLEIIDDASIQYCDSSISINVGFDDETIVGYKRSDDGFGFRYYKIISQFGAVRSFTSNGQSIPVRSVYYGRRNFITKLDDGRMIFETTGSNPNGTMYPSQIDKRISNINGDTVDDQLRDVICVSGVNYLMGNTKTLLCKDNGDVAVVIGDGGTPNTKYYLIENVGSYLETNDNSKTYSKILAISSSLVATIEFLDSNGDRFIGFGNISITEKTADLEFSINIKMFDDYIETMDNSKIYCGSFSAPMIQTLYGLCLTNILGSIYDAVINVTYSVYHGLIGIGASLHGVPLLERWHIPANDIKPVVFNTPTAVIFQFHSCITFVPKGINGLRNFLANQFKISFPSQYSPKQLKDVKITEFGKSVLLFDDNSYQIIDNISFKEYKVVHSLQGLGATGQISDPTLKEIFILDSGKLFYVNSNSLKVYNGTTFVKVECKYSIDKYCIDTLYSRLYFYADDTDGTFGYIDLKTNETVIFDTFYGDRVRFITKRGNGEVIYILTMNYVYMIINYKLFKVRKISTKDVIENFNPDASSIGFVNVTTHIEKDLYLDGVEV